MRYRIGILERDAETEEYDSQADAEVAAIALSYGDSPVGVWDEHDDLVAIVYQQQTFWP